jgi:uncharacterized protein (TIGR02145 family)
MFKLLIIICISFLFISCSNSTEPVEVLPETVIIGNQVWMTKNLDVVKFRNGDTIPQAKTNEEWYLAGKYQRPAWCYYNNDPEMGKKYGKLYNYYALTDERVITPYGYRIPNAEDWAELFQLTGGKNTAAYYLKSKSGWIENGEGNNEIKFTALPGGYRDIYGSFASLGSTGYWWVGDGYDYFKETVMMTYWSKSTGNYLAFNPRYGFSVRCLKYY